MMRQAKYFLYGDEFDAPEAVVLLEAQVACFSRLGAPLLGEAWEPIVFMVLMHGL